MVFFRGGWAGLTNDRSNEVFTDVFEFSGSNDKNNGYYVGAGLDLVLSRNVWDLLPGTWVLGEIGVEYKRFNSKNVTQAVPSTCKAAIPSSGCSIETNKKVQITMLTRKA